MSVCTLKHSVCMLRWLRQEESGDLRDIFMIRSAEREPCSNSPECKERADVKVFEIRVRTPCAGGWRKH